MPIDATVLIHLDILRRHLQFKKSQCDAHTYDNTSYRLVWVPIFYLGVNPGFEIGEDPAQVHSTDGFQLKHIYLDH